jgi:hypothetical protein
MQIWYQAGNEVSDIEEFEIPDAPSGTGGAPSGTGGAPSGTGGAPGADGGI